MTLYDQWWLMAGIAGLYLYDSVLLLFHDEVVLEARRGNCLVSGGTAMEFRGRHLFLPNPLCPHRPLMRLNWRADEAADNGTPSTRRRRTRLALSVIAPWTWLLLGLFFIGLPGALWFGTDLLLLGWLLLTYLIIVLTIGQVWRHHNALNLTGRAVVALAFDALLCAPFAINMVRKISLRQVPRPSLGVVASSMLSPAEHIQLCGILRERIQISLDFQEPDTAASRSLRAYLKRIEDIVS